MGEPGPFVVPPVVETTSRRGVWIVLGVVSTLAVGVLVAGVVLVRSDKVPTDTFWVPSQSMEPTYMSGDIVMTRGIDGDDASRGDVVVLRRPVESEDDLEFLMKRVVAVAGDEVSAADGQLLINGRAVDEPYLAEGTVTDLYGEDVVVVPPDHVYVLGDNRENSQDSRWFGPIPNDDIIYLVTGRAPGMLQP